MRNKLEKRLEKIKKERNIKLSNWNIKHNNNTWNQIEDLIKEQKEIEQKLINHNNSKTKKNNKNKSKSKRKRKTNKNSKPNKNSKTAWGQKFWLNTTRKIGLS